MDSTPQAVPLAKIVAEMLAMSCKIHKMAEGAFTSKFMKFVNLDYQKLEFHCPGCSRVVSARIRQVKENPALSCAHCKTIFNVTGETVTRAIHEELEKVQAFKAALNQAKN